MHKCEPHRKAKILWQCRRGMLELDFILNRFIEERFENLSAEELLIFENLLTQADPDLYAWFMGYVKPVPEFEIIVGYIRNGSRA